MLYMGSKDMKIMYRADDSVLIAQSHDDRQKLFHRFNTTAKILNILTSTQKKPSKWAFS